MNFDEGKKISEALCCYKNKILKAVFLTFFCIFPLTNQFAQTTENNLKGFALSQFLSDSLNENEIAFEKQGLGSFDASSFPYNIIVPIKASGVSDKNKKIPWYESNVENVIFSFPQDFALLHFDEIVKTYKKLSETPFSFSIQIFFGANDEKSILPQSSLYKHPSGTEIFTSSIYNTDSSCAIVFIPSSTNVEIVPGGNHDVSPLYLVKALKTATIKAGVNAKIPLYFSLLYRLGILEEENRLSLFLKEGIPSVGIKIQNQTEFSDVILQTALELEDGRSLSWDRHYTFIPIGIYGFWPGEAFYTLFYLLFTFITLLSTCFSAFSKSSRGKAVAKDLTRTWYLLPIILATSTGLLFGTQKIFSHLDDSVLVFGLKILLTFFVTFLLFVLQVRFNFRTAFYALGYFGQFVSAINIVIFTSIDLSLLFIFFYEYLLMIFAKHRRKMPSLILSFIFPIIPFIPLMQAFLSTASEEALRQFVFTDIWGNIFLALILLPFELLWERILIASEILSKNHNISRLKVIFSAIAMLILSVGLLSAFYFFSTSQIIKHMRSIVPLKYPEIVSAKPEEKSPIDLLLSEDAFMELTMHHLIIRSECDVLRYEISVESEDSVPLYDSNYNYTFDGTHKVLFQIPDFPDRELEIVYSSEALVGAHIQVTSYIQAENDSIKTWIQDVYTEENQ